MTSSLLCPICQTPQLPTSSVCPGCGENLAPLLHIQARHTLMYNLALRLAKEGQTEKAIANLVQANELAPNDPAILVVLGKLYAQQGRYENAKSSWTKALELCPSMVEAEAGMRRLEDMAQEATAVKANHEKEKFAGFQRERQLHQRRYLMTLVGVFAAGFIALYLLQLVWPRSPTNQTTFQGGAPVTSFPTVTNTATPTATPTVTLTATVVPSPTITPTVAPPTFVPSPTVPNYALAVQLAIKARPELADYNITVKQEGGVVHLIGLVPTLYIRYQVESIARGVQGIALLDIGELRLMHSYIIQPGDTPWSVTERFYGNGRLFPALLQANNLEINAWHPGLELVLPEPGELK